ncbi:hypothetical protein PRK78_007276 [Emydomyces testavorans]|uniref:Uncharacterized protein n=1 Tax=Emydomyces testavorans TaxID=2070801 RepID=A0AAF0ILA5_9EURO|nr:hypothetical protein PRK78_007276 [Emydomyces testavorans]
MFANNTFISLNPQGGMAPIYGIIIIILAVIYFLLRPFAEAGARLMERRWANQPSPATDAGASTAHPITPDSAVPVAPAVAPAGPAPFAPLAPAPPADPPFEPPLVPSGARLRRHRKTRSLGDIDAASPSI